MKINYKAAVEKLLFTAEAIMTGLIAGIVGSAFHHILYFVTELRRENPHILFLLPLAGVVISLIYKFTRQDKFPGTDYVLSAVAEKKKIPFLMSVAIFLSTALTHLCGGSAGREGAALQLGGSIASKLGDAFRFDGEKRRVLIMCGMGGVFSALFGTPLTACIFVLEVVFVGNVYCRALIPSLLSSLTAFCVAGFLGGERVHFEVEFPAFDIEIFLKALVLILFSTGVSIGFSSLMRFCEHRVVKLIKNPFLRAAVGGGVIVILTLLAGNQNYNGAGMPLIEKAMTGEAQWYDFLLKIIFTVITISCGFKGGEIVPAFFIGSTFGCFVGNLLGLPAGMGGALGLISVFCAGVNCPLASIFLGLELFGGEGMIFIALAAVISNMFSSRFSLYSREYIFKENSIVTNNQKNIEQNKGE